MIASYRSQRLFESKSLTVCVKLDRQQSDLVSVRSRAAFYGGERRIIRDEQEHGERLARSSLAYFSGAEHGSLRGLAV
jgi:hypothetical protein